MKHLAAALLASTLVVAPAHAGPMTVANFLSRVEVLKARGPMALFSSDVKVLRREVEGIAADYKVQNSQAHAAGRPHSCPTGSKMGRDEFLTELQRIPPAQRGMSMRQGFATVMKRRYPCPG